MEANGIRKYRVLRTYADWVAHIELNRQPHAHLLARFTKYVDEKYVKKTGKPPDTKDNGWIKELVEHALSPFLLREEIIDIFETFGVSLRSIADAAVLEQLITLACLEIMEKPLDLRTMLLHRDGHVDKEAAKKILLCDAENYAVAVGLLIENGHVDTPGKVLVAQVLIQSILDKRKLVFSLPLAVFSEDGTKLALMGLST